MGISKFVKDGWSNLFKGIGGARDTNKGNFYGDLEVILDHELASMYVGDGWQKKVASIPAMDMTREWIALAEDPDGSLDKQVLQLGAKNAFYQAIVWQRVFRGGLIWMISSKKPNQVYAPGEKIDIKKLSVFSASEVRIEEIYGADVRITPGMNRAEQQLDPERIGEVKSFKILRNRKRTQDIIVDASQCLVFRGDPIPSVPDEGFENYFDSSNVSAIEYEYWGVGALQTIYSQMSKYGVFEEGMGKISTELVVAIYKIAGLREILQADDGPEMIKKRIEVIDQAKSMINAVFMDAEGDEAFERNTINLAGVPDLWDRFMMTVAGVSNIPASKLFGRQASGLNNKGEQDERNYNSMISGEQEKDMLTNLKILLGHLTGTDVDFTFNSPWAPSQAELIDMRSKQAETDERYIRNQVLTPEEVRGSRFDENYSFETALIEPPDLDVGVPDDDNLPGNEGNREPGDE